LDLSPDLSPCLLDLDLLISGGLGLGFGLEDRGLGLGHGLGW